MASDDDRFLFGCGRLWFPYSEELLYAAIGFSVLVEVINQSKASQSGKASYHYGRYRTASAVLRMLGSKSTGSSDNQSSDKEDVLAQ